MELYATEAHPTTDRAQLGEETLDVLERLAGVLQTDVEMLLAVAEGQMDVDGIMGVHSAGACCTIGTLAEWNELVRAVADDSENGWQAQRRREQAARDARFAASRQAKDREKPVRPCVLYRLLDKTGRVLYIGVSRNPTARIKAHRKKWGDLIASVTTEDYPDAAAMLAAEAEAIRTENPPLNIAGVDGDYAAE